MTEQHDASRSTGDEHVEASERPADPRFAEAMRRLDSLSELPLAEQVEAYESVHSSLQESLADAAHPGEERQPRRAPS